MKTVATLALSLALLLVSAPRSEAMVRTVDQLSQRVDGGVIRSPRLHITASIIGRYRTVRTVHGHQHTFYGIRVSACVDPVQWAKNAASGATTTSRWIGGADEWFFGNVTLPCVTGVGAGWVKTSTEQLSRRLVWLGGFMSRAKYNAGVAGPEGYAVAGVGGCAVTLGVLGVYKAARLARKLGTGP